jgi:hypothetical protein
MLRAPRTLTGIRPKALSTRTVSGPATHLGGEGCGGQGVAVGVDADDAVDELCQHGHCGGPP